MRGFDGSLTPRMLNTFGGLVTFVDRMDLTENVSPDNQNVIYGRGTVGSRGGTSVFANPGAAAATINGMFNYTKNDGTFHVVISNATATTRSVSYESSAGPTFTVFVSLLDTGTFTMGDSHYGRAWLAIHDGNFGTHVPVKFNGTTASRVGSERPSTLTAILAEVAGTGTFTAGAHLFRMTFETDAGFSTPPSKSMAKTTTGTAATGLQFTQLPLGPTGTVRRVIWAATVTDSAATDPTGFVGTTQNYYTLRMTNWVIPNNTSTTWTIDGFTDAQFSLGESMIDDRLWTIAPIPPVAGLVFYKSRYFYYGALGTFQPEYVSATAIENYTFDGGEWGGAPIGWTPTGTGGLVVASQDSTGGSWWRMTGDGATASVGIISQVATGVHPYPAFTPGVNYGVRLRCKKNSTLTTGTLRITSTINAVATTFSVTAASMSSDNLLTFSSGTTPFITGQTNSGDAGPNPIRVELLGTPSSGGICYLDWLDFYDVLKPTAGSQVYCSSIDMPETVDAETGFLLISPDDGQIIHSAFVLRDNLYFVKDRSIYTTSDNGATEPSGWSVSKVDDTIGTSFSQGVGIGDGWVVIAARSGLYYFDGGLPQKLSQEIQPDWDTINWPTTAAWKPLDVKVDVEAKRIYVALCTGSNTSCNVTYVLDYLEGITTDPVTNGGVGRKWTKWTDAATGNSLLLAERSTGKKILLFGKLDAAGFLYQYDATVHNDASDATPVAISSYYDTAPLGADMPGVSYFGGALSWVGGLGTFTLSKKIPAGTVTTVGTATLVTPATKQVPMLQNDATEGLTYRFQTNAIGEYWNLNRFTVYMKQHMWFPLRG